MYIYFLFPHGFRGYYLGKNTGSHRSKAVNTDTTSQSLNLPPNAEMFPFVCNDLPAVH